MTENLMSNCNHFDPMLIHKNSKDVQEYMLVTSKGNCHNLAFQQKDIIIAH